MIVTDELLKEFEETWPYIPSMDVWPKQLKYQYKLFLLEKGHYGIKPSTELKTTTENQEAPSKSGDASV